VEQRSSAQADLREGLQMVDVMGPVAFFRYRSCLSSGGPRVSGSMFVRVLL
jgi:hypothetical protein